MSRNERMYRSLNSNLKTRAEGEGSLIIEGYFAVFNSVADLGYGMYEEIAPGAFDNTLGNDIRALINHDTSLVIGRNKAGTLDLRVDSRGLWGTIYINPNDTDAMNLYERVKRGDVDQCSFGFNIVSEDTDFRDDGTVKWTIREVDLHEVSVVTFPAYEQTSIKARKKDLDALTQRRLDAKKEKLKERLNNLWR